MKKKVLLCLFIIIMVSIPGLKSIRSVNFLQKHNFSDFGKDWKNKVAEIKLLHNMHIPRNVLISFHPGNESVIQNLYTIIDKINKSENLKDDAGFNQRISLSLVMPSHYRGDNDKIVKVGNQKKEFDKMRRALFARLSDTVTNNTPLNAVYVSNGDIIWMQDIVEIGGVKLKGEVDFIPALFDLQYHNPDPMTKTFALLSGFFKIPTLVLNGQGAETTESADTGGNVEVTHEGVVYVGNKISQDLFDDLFRLTRQKIVELPTEWLHVGHVDEVLFFIPARNSCGAALVHANPLEALQLILKNKKWDKPFYSELKKSFLYFLKPGIKQKLNYIITDFDLKKMPRKIGNKNEKKHGNYSDWFVLENLRSYINIMKSVAILKKSSVCLNELVSLPVIMEEPADEEIHTKPGMMAYNPLTNALVLRDHVILPKGDFVEIALERIGKVVGNGKVHVIDTGWYEQHQGALHCATTVIRDPERVLILK